MAMGVIGKQFADQMTGAAKAVYKAGGWHMYNAQGRQGFVPGKGADIWDEDDQSHGTWHVHPWMIPSGHRSNWVPLDTRTGFQIGRYQRRNRWKG